MNPCIYKAMHICQMLGYRGKSGTFPILMELTIDGGTQTGNRGTNFKIGFNFTWREVHRKSRNQRVSRLGELLKEEGQGK